MNVPVHFVCEDVTDSSQFGPLLPTYANPRIMGTVGADSIPAPLLASAGVAWPDRTHILNQGHDYLFCVSCVGHCCMLYARSYYCSMYSRSSRTLGRTSNMLRWLVAYLSRTRSMHSIY